jgi:hypothetical protein
VVLPTLAFTLVHERMVKASGDIVEVAKQCNSDSSWAIQGAGSNFGIITLATYEVQPFIDNADVFGG